MPLSFSLFVLALSVCVRALSVLIPYSDKRRDKIPILFNTLLEFIDADMNLVKPVYTYKRDPFAFCVLGYCFKFFIVSFSINLR